MEHSVRKSNFELLRIISMLMIVGAHCTSIGLIHTLAAESNMYQVWENGKEINKLISLLFYPGGSGC